MPTVEDILNEVCERAGLPTLEEGSLTPDAVDKVALAQNIAKAVGGTLSAKSRSHGPAGKPQTDIGIAFGGGSLGSDYVQDHLGLYIVPTDDGSADMDMTMRRTVSKRGGSLKHKDIGRHKATVDTHNKLVLAVKAFVAKSRKSKWKG